MILDQWHTVPGDQLPEFMEMAVRENDYVLIVCTPRYKDRSDKRVGGVGYEGDVMTGEVMTKRNHRKFIPILRRGTWQESAPSWLAGKRYVDLAGSPYSEHEYHDLLTTMLGTRPQPPPVGQGRSTATAASVSPDPGRRSDDLARRLAELRLDDEARQDFAESRVTAGVAQLDSRYAMLAAIPVEAVSCSPTRALSAAKAMLEPGKWYNPTPDDHPPRYWPYSIFKVPERRRSDQNAFFWEDRDYSARGGGVHSRLAITDRAEVFFVSSQAAGFVTKLRDQTGVFLLGRIVAECWQFSGLVAQLYTELALSGHTHLCIAMVGTESTHLGAFAKPFAEPSDPWYWAFIEPGGHDWTCHARNLKFCQKVDVMHMEPKKQPEFLNDFAESISLAYNHDTPRCFDKETGLLPAHYFRSR